MQENVYEIRKKKNLYFVKPVERYLGENRDVISRRNAAVIVNLYYVEDAKMYLEKMLKVPESITLYIISSNESVCEIAKIFFLDHKRNNFEIIKKSNRGRDVSALLVAAAEIVKRHEYICFLHDKKEKEAVRKADNQLWIENLWGNLIASEEYIKNIFDIFDKNVNIGLLVPPEPIGEYIDVWGHYAWGRNYEIVKALESELELECNINKEYAPITFGTAFWCKTKALKKLWSKEWKYEDFIDEPMPNDGTISHAIERILAYVAQDAGFYTGTVMTCDYAAKHANIMQSTSRDMGQLLSRSLNVTSIENAKMMSNATKRMKEFCDKYSDVYLYGAGKIGERCLKFLLTEGIVPKAIIVSKVEGNNKKVNGIPVVTIDEIKVSNSQGIIISVGEKIKDEIIYLLQKRKIYNYMWYMSEE